MAVRNLRKGQILRPAKQTVQSTRYPAPIKGVDFRLALTAGDPLLCSYTYNLIPYENGMTVRSGYREWQVGLDQGASEGVHTIISYDGLENSKALDRLFAVTNEGIYDVTVQGAAPILKMAFSDQQPEAGYGVYTHYMTDAEEDLLLYADSINGLFTYSATTDVWAQAANIIGPVIEDINFIVLHKQRLWMIEENSSKAWYLDIGAVAGTATEFFFGSKFKYGGNLVGLFNWTVDGGEGVDDYLVAVGRAGDILPYKGADPSIVDGANAWGLVGTYYIGEIPVGPFFGSEHGGELFLLSANGLTSMNDLLQGVNRDARTAEGYVDSISGAVSGDMRARIRQTANKHGWQVQTIPSAGGLMVSTPRVGSNAYIQYFYTFATQAWALLRDLPILCFDSWQGVGAFGDDQSRVLYMDVSVDDFKLVQPIGRLNGDAIKFSVLSAFQSLEAPAQYKQVQMIRPDFLAYGQPVYTVEARYDYNQREVVAAAAPPLAGDSLWGTGVWDTAFWSSGDKTERSSIAGAWGTGRYVAVAMTGSSREATEFIGWDLLYTTGGALI